MKETLYKFEGKFAFLNLLLEELQEEAKKLGFATRVDLDSFEDKKIFEFQKDNTLLSITLDSIETDRGVLIIQGDKSVKDVFFSGLERFLKKHLNAVYESLNNSSDKRHFTMVVKSIWEKRK